MICPDCGSDRTEVLDTRKLGGNVYRRRKCRACKWQWATHETSLTAFQVAQVRAVFHGWKEGRTRRKWVRKAIA